MLRAIWKRTSIDALECKYNNGNMVSSTVPVCFILCLFVTFGRSFYPNSIGVDISEDDYTISSITRQAILNVTAQFLQSLLPNSTSVSLETLDPLTESSLFNAYYGGKYLLSIHFSRSIDAQTDISRQQPMNDRQTL